MGRKIPFEVGDLVTYDGSNQAHITFTSHDYITVCTHQWPDEGSTVWSSEASAAPWSGRNTKLAIEVLAEVH